MAVAVLNAESGYQTCPAWWCTCASESMFAGSAGIITSTELVSTAITPTGMPPRRARPVMTVLAHPPSISVNEPLSNRPDSHPEGSTEEDRPVMRTRGSYGSEGGTNVTSRSTGSAAITSFCIVSEYCGAVGGKVPCTTGKYDTQCRIAFIPSKSSRTVKCETPLLYMICGPPS